MTQRPPTPRALSGPRALLAANYGLAIWALCFLVLYILLSVGCQLPTLADSQLLGLPALTLLLSSLWLLHAAWLLWLLGRAHRRWKALTEAPADAKFASMLTLTLHGGALLAVIWTGFPIVLLPACM